MAVAPVGSVYPPNFDASITNTVICGDGSVVLGSPGQQFGTVTPRVIQTFGPTGLPSAQSFGAVKTALRFAVGSVASAQSFGTVGIRLQKAVGGVGSAQVFGAVTAKAVFVSTVGAISSAQAFGTVSIVKGAVTSSAAGVPSAQSFGSLTFRTVVTRSVGAVTTAQSFGAITARTAVTRTVTGLGSAQGFGAITTRSGFTQAVSGLASAQSFGVAKGVINQIVPVQGVLPYGPSIVSITGGVICGDGHLCGYKGGPPSQFGHPTIKTGPVTVVVAGIPSAQQFGVPFAYVVYIREDVCIDLDLAQLLCTDLAPATSTSTSLTLAQAVCTDLTLDVLVSEDVVLQPTH